MPGLTRREFLAGSAAAGAAVPFAALLAACGDSVPLAVRAAAQRALEPFTFTEAQRHALVAAVSRLIPATGPDDWSAADAGAVEYLEQLLNAFVTDGNPRIYGGGPSRASFATFWKLPRIKQVAWMAEIERLRSLYVEGLDALNRQSAGGSFADLAPESQDTLLLSQDTQGTRFFAALFAHTMEAAYSHPVYGGNKDFVGWKSVRYQGDVHGVRFPGGHDPNADHEPWRKYGGYAPDEMIGPGDGT